MSEVFIAIPVRGKDIRCRTPAAAWVALDRLAVAGEVVCINDAPDIPNRFIVARKHTDGTWESFPSPVPVEE